MIYPEFPRQGDVIGICAPSAGIGGKKDSFLLSLEAVEEQGFELHATESVWNDSFPSAPAEVRGSEFNALYKDDDIAMVLCASGGDYNVEMLPYIDQDAVLAHPKWFAGYSDPTAIELLMTTRLDIASIYGVNAGAWQGHPLHEFQHNALEIIKGNIVDQHSYDLFSSSGFNEEAGRYIFDTPVEWILLGCGEDGFYEADSLDVTGRLIGGCIDVIDSLIGTPFEDLKGFARRYSSDGLIWFFDDFALDPMELMYSMTKMKFMGLFDDARAVIFGRVCFPGDHSDYDYLLQLERVFTDVPVIWNADIGHTKPSMTVINGSIGHLVYEDGQASLSMSLE